MFIVFPLVLGGILGDAFSKLFGLLWDVVGWIGDLLRNLFQGIIDIIIGFFEVIYALIDGLLYLLFSIGLLAVKLFLVFFEVGKLLVSFIAGIGNTLSSLSYSTQASSGNGYSSMIGKVFAAAGPLQINSIAYVLLFVLWLSTAYGAIRIISTIKEGS